MPFGWRAQTVPVVCVSQDAGQEDFMNGGDFDYIIVGSGAGGGPLAANLARRGFTVLLLEAGGDSCSECDTGRLMYEVPIFHGLSTEYEGCSWNFFVRHYSDDAQQERDSKFV